MDTADELRRDVLRALDPHEARSADDVLKILREGEQLKRVFYWTGTMEKVLRALAAEGLAEEQIQVAQYGASTATRRWVLTDAGRAALET